MHRLSLIILLIALAPVRLYAQFTVTQGRFDTAAGWQTRNISDAPYTNYFAKNPFSTNFVSIGDYASNFTVETSFAVTSEWQGNFGGWTTHTNWTQSVVALSPGSGKFSLQLTNLYPGLYGIQVFGVVTDAVAYAAWRLPLIWKIKASDAVNGTTNVYHTAANYVAGTNYDIGQFWVQAVQNSGPSNNIYVEASLDAQSQVHAKITQLHFFAPVDWTDTNIYKSVATTFTTNEQQSRVAFGLTNTSDTTVLGWLNGTPTLPTLTTGNLTNLFNRWIPLNAMSDEQSGNYVTNVSTWSAAPFESVMQNYGNDFALPWGWTNTTTHTHFALADFLSGTSVPGSSSDLVGFYYSGGVWVSSFGSGEYGMYSEVSGFVMPMIVSRSSADTSLAYRWFTFPTQTNAAHSAGLIFAKLALTYPSYRLEAMDINANSKNPSAYLGYDLGRWSLRRTGKLEYDGDAGLSQGLIAQGLDYLWPYVSTSAAFASDLTKFVPWINSSTNNVKLFFESHVLRSLAFDNGYRARGGDPMLLGLVMQNGVTSSNLMNPVIAQVEVDPATVPAMSWKKTYAGTFNRDGINLIGSSGYVVSENPLVQDPDYTRRFKLNGGMMGTFDISNPTNWPKLSAFVNYYDSSATAYGYNLAYGDSGGSINEGPYLKGATAQFTLSLWRLYPDPRLGAYIVNTIGRSTQTDAEWSTMLTQASSGLDIRFPNSSRILSGIGVGALEFGIGSSLQSQRGSVVLRTVGGQGHQHYDHLDLNIFALGARMGTDIACRDDTVQVYPRCGATMMHNVIDVDSYESDKNNDATSGWPPGNNTGNYSQYTAISTNGLSQFIGAEEYNTGFHTNVTYQHRDVALCQIDSTNFYVVDFQRVNGGHFQAWTFHGADVGGEAAGFTPSITMTNTPLNIVLTNNNPAYYLRKFATNSPYQITQNGSAPSKLYAEWRLGRTATTSPATNADGNGFVVTTIAPEQVMYGSAYNSGSPRKVTRATLFDRTGETVASAWLFAGQYQLLQPRLYVFNTNAGFYYSNSTDRSSTWAALYDCYAGSRLITNEASLSTDNALTNAWMPKALQVDTAAFSDRHYSSGTNVDVVSGGDTWNGSYAFARDIGGTMAEMKLVGGTKLVHGGLTLTMTTNNLVQSISAASWTNNQLTLSGSWPGVRRSCWYRMRNANHETSYYVTSWASASVANFYSDARVGELDMGSISGNNITFSGTGEGGMALASLPKLGNGITGVNETFSKFVHVNYSDLTPTAATRIDGDSIATGDFTDADGDGHISMFLYDFGPNDTMETPTEVTVHKNSSTSYTIAANAAFTFSGFTAGNWAINGTLLVAGAVPVGLLTGDAQEVVQVQPAGITTLTVNQLNFK